jgi:hypothetical protein
MEKIKVSLKSDRITSTLHEDHWIFLIMTCSDLRRMRNVPDNSCTGDQNTYSVFNTFFFKS